VTDAALAPLDGRSLPDGSGGKARNLHWLARHGARVPVGVVLPAGETHRLEDAAGRAALVVALAAALGPGP